MERAFKGIWIPKEIWLDTNLSWVEKFLLVEIESLDNEQGCWASNEYFANFFNISKGRVSKIISNLHKKKYLTVTLEYKEDTKQVTKRIIRVTNLNKKAIVENDHTPIVENDHTPIVENDHTPIVENDHTPIVENDHTPIVENDQYNNTSFNNTSFNNTKDIESKKSSRKYSDEHLRLSLKLQSNLSSDFPKEMNKVNINKWADVIRLMEERDQLTITQIEYVIDWLPTNDFWFGNIRSTFKLREKFDKLVFEIKTEKQKSEQPKNKFRGSARQEQLPEWAKKEYQPVKDEIDPEVERRLAEYAKRNGA